MSTKGMHLGGVRTLAELKARSEEVGDCWEWQGYINEFKMPTVRFEGMARSARRVAWVLANGLVPNGMVVANACNNHRCVNPAHQKPSKNEATFARHRSPTSDALRHARIATTKRAQMGVGPQVVTAVRASPTANAAQLAAELGISTSTVYKLRRQALSQSPWGALMRGAA